MDLSVDLPDLMESLDDHEVYVFKKGRCLDDDDPPVPDIISVGLNELHAGKSSPLKDFNKAFQRLQARRRLVPLVGVEDLTAPQNPDPDVHPPCVVAPTMSSPHPPPLSAPPVQLPTGQQITNERDEIDCGDEGEDEDEEDDEDEGDHGDQKDEGGEDITDVGGFDEVEEEDDGEELGEFLQSFEDDLEPTLSLETAADVSLDMDIEDVGGGSDVELEDDGNVSGQDSDDQGEGSPDSDAEF